MSDRAEFYRRFPIKPHPNSMTMRESALIPITEEANGNNGKWWVWHNVPDYTMWRLLVPSTSIARVFVVWFDEHGNFKQANGEGMIFYGLKCFIDYVDGVEHESQICRRAI